MKVIGITGTIGSGKSVILKHLSNLGAKVIDSDRVTLELSEPGEPLYEAIRKEFGDSFIREDKKLDKEKLREYVFSDKSALQKLNEISRDILVGVLVNKVMTVRDRETVVIEAVRLYDTGLYRICDEVWFVFCENNCQVQRVVERSGLEEEQVWDILNSQQDIAKMKEIADYRIDNSGTIEETIAQIDAIYHGNEEN